MMLNLNNYICALDIGSSKIAASVAQIKKGRVNNIFFDSVLSRGVKCGAIIDSIGLVDAIGKLMKNLKARSGINIKSLHTNISGQDIVTKRSRAIIPLAERGNKVITVSDIQKVNEQARILGSSLEEDILHIVPSGYSIDSKSNIANPLGLYSHRLEVDLYLICAKLSSIQTLSRIINQSGYEIKDLSLSGLATAKAVFNRELMGNGLNLFCDIGSDTTELLIFRDGVLKDTGILPIGGDNLTAQLQDSLKIPFELAEDIKRSYGLVGDSAQIGEDKEILVKKSNLYKPIKQRLVSEIITQSAKLICSGIKDAVEKKVSSHEVNNFVVAGRTVLLEGFMETLENALSIQVRLGRITNPDIPVAIKESPELSGQKYLTYLTALGMICEVLQDKAGNSGTASKPAKNSLLNVVNRFREVYQEYF
ncbi:MAG: cell division protein FtsA [Candidatus Omnitrophota bacterium]